MTATRTTARPVPFGAELRTLAFVVAAGAMMTFLDSTIINVAITSLVRGFHTSLSTIQWVLTGYGLSLSMIIPVTGWAVDRLGAKTAWIASLVVFIVGSVLCGAAWNVTALIVFRVIQGIGGGMILPIGQIMLARTAGPDRMARAMGAAAIPAMLGPVLGPVLGGLIVDDLSWRWIFFVNVPLCALALVLAVKLLPRDSGPGRVPARLDGRGLMLLAPGLTLLMYGLSQVGADLVRPWIWVAAGAAFVAAYVFHTRWIETPLVSVRVFACRAFAVSSTAMFVYLVAVYGFMVVLPVYFQVLRGESPLNAGLLLVPLAIGGGLSMAVSGRLADQVSARWIIVAGMVTVAAGAVMFTRLGPGASLPMVIGALSVISLGHGAILPPAMGSAYQGMPRREIPPATATFNVIFRLSSSFGTALLAVVLQDAIFDRARVSSLADAAHLHGAQARAALTSAFADSFWWVAVIAVLAAVPALFIPARKGAVSMQTLLSPGVESPADRPSVMARD